MKTVMQQVHAEKPEQSDVKATSQRIPMAIRRRVYRNGIIYGVVSNVVFAVISWAFGWTPIDWHFGMSRSIGMVDGILIGIVIITVCFWIMDRVASRRSK